MRKLSIDRATLAKIAPNPQALRELERVFGEVSTMPSTIEEAVAQANQAIAMAASLLALAADLASAVEALESAPAREGAIEPDDTAPAPAQCPETDDATPRVQLGTISSQNADNVDLDGGTIDGIEIGTDTPDKAAFTTVSASESITSTVADGNPPLVIASTTKVDNLHVARAALADTAESISGAAGLPPNATDLPTAITLVNAIKVLLN